MGTSLILASSIVVQFTAAFLALRLIPVTGRRKAWIAVSIALFLMGVSRCMALYELMSGGTSDPSIMVNGEVVWLTLVISALMLAGIAWIAPLFQSIARSTATLIESEARFRTLAEARMKTEEELKRYQQRLEDLVSERTAELMETVGCLQREITERASAEEAIEELNRRNRLILESMGVGVFGLDLNGTVTFVNQSAARMLGWSQVELIGRCMHSLAHHSKSDGSPYPLEECPARRACETGDNQHVIGELFWRKDGSFFPVELVSIPMCDEMGQTMGAVATFNDITERIRAENIMMKERERFSVILDGNPIPSFVIDREHRVVLWNRACELLTGASRAEVLGKPVESRIFYQGPPRPVLADLVLDMGLEAMEELYGSRRLDRSSFHPEAFEAIDLLTIGGKKKSIYFLAARLKDANGEIIGAIETLLDVTDQIELQRQLRQTQKMEAIGTLAGGIAHDFNNILTAIIGYTEIALDDLPEGSKTQRNLEQVIQAGHRARELVRQILTFSRKNEQDRQPVKISQIVKEALHFLRASLPSTITIHQRITSDSALVLADPTQIHQVLMNLCSNAAHAMRERGGELEVGLEAASLDGAAGEPGIVPGSYVKLTVKDTGYGIEREVMERIFDPYFTTKIPGEGTGMGLSVVHGIVTSYGGTISVQSEPGAGTSFEVLIPRIEHVTNVNDSEAGELLPAGKERILLVDDEEIIVEMEQLMLERLGYQVTGRTGSLEALEAFRADPESFDLVITDQTMPNMTGVELCKELMDIRPGIPIILCTGFSDLVTPEKAEAMGIGAFLEKPLARRQIAPAIRRLLDRVKS